MDLKIIQNQCLATAESPFLTAKYFPKIPPEFSASGDPGSSEKVFLNLW